MYVQKLIIVLQLQVKMKKVDTPENQLLTIVKSIVKGILQEQIIEWYKFFW